MPGALDHASGDVEEFEAGIIAGADGIPDEPGDDAELEAEAVDASPAAHRAVGIDRGGPTAHQPVQGRGGSRVLGFLRACVAELQRVQWPDRRQVGQATAVVLGFVVIAGAYLGLADVVAQKIIDVIL
ncbi:MAG TPA: preprotein translocase subunit SecE [Solirubrobacteraceae bacterium]|nr:preprotein translocase subunit SecE [Solirubrobacteraceae bacterium]